MTEGQRRYLIRCERTGVAATGRHYGITPGAARRLHRESLDAIMKALWLDHNTPERFYFVERNPDKSLLGLPAIAIPSDPPSLRRSIR